MRGLKAIRMRLGMTQEKMGEVTGIAPNTLSRYERGALTPSADAVSKIAKALNVTTDELLNGPGLKDFEVKIVMGVRNLTGLASMEVTDNSFIFGVQDDKPQIHLAGKIMIGTPEEREAAKALLLAKFERACWMFDHKDDEKEGE